MRPPPSSDDPTLGFLWPTGAQQQLLDAALLHGAAARAAFLKWRSTVDLEAEFGWTLMRLFPLVHDSLVRAGETDPLMGRLKGVSRMTWYETQQLLHRARPAIAALHAAGVPVLMLKGAPMVLSYYSHAALRPMSDVDVCVPLPDVDRAMALLAAAGWRPTSQDTPDYRRFRHAMQFRHPNGGEMDLHWTPMYEAMQPDSQGWGWDDTEPLDFLGVPVLQLRPTSMLLHHVVHGVRWNPETPVRWIPDAVTVLRTRANEIDWEQLGNDARRLQVTLRLRLGLEWLAGRYDVVIPTGLRTALRETSPTLTERIEGRVYLRDHRRYLHSALGNQLVILADLCRIADPARVPTLLATLPHYLRYRWGLGGRRQILPALWRASLHRLQGQPQMMESAR